MARIISFFNHKGGVSKTTTAFNLGWMLAEKEKRVMLVDCDPQCNLTGMILNLQELDSADQLEVYENKKPKNIRDGLRPAFESLPSPINSVDLIKMSDNLFLLPGNIGLAEYEVTLGISQELSGSILTLKNLPGSIRHLLDLTARENDIEIIIVDMNPSLGALNQNLFSISDFFIVPTHPDYFSNLAIKSLSQILPKWKKWATKAAENPILKEANYPFPNINTKFIGYIVQNYRPRSGSPSAAFQKWIDQLTISIDKKLIPTLKESDLMLSEHEYQNIGIDPKQAILQMPNFNSLIALSQEHRVPIFRLTAEQIGQTGSVLSNTQESQENFRELFKNCAEKIIKVLNETGN